MRGRRGHSTITAMALIPMLGFAALSIDIGLQKTINTQMQSTFDLAAMSGAQRLDGTREGLEYSIYEINHVVENSTIYFDYKIDIDNIVFGRYEDDIFAELSTVDYRDINAVRLSGSHNYSSVLSHAAFGVSPLSSGAESIAVRPVGGVAKHVECYLPFAIPSCHFNSLSGEENPPPLSLDLTNLNTIGWGSPYSTPSTSEIVGQLSDQCSGGTASVYDESDGDTQSNNIYIANGQNNAAVRFISDVINEKIWNVDPGEWPDEYFPGPYLRDGASANLALQSDISARNWGNNVGGVVPIVEANCGQNMTGSVRITGWTYAYIYDTKTSKSGGKNIWMQFDVVNEYDFGYGNTDDGEGNITGTTPAILVK
jgi:hypothetical protein